MNVLDRFWGKDKLIQRTFEIECDIFDKVEDLSLNVYDASISKIINACIDELVETENINLHPKKKGEICLKHTLSLRKTSLDNLEMLKKKYGIALCKLLDMSIRNVLSELDEVNGSIDKQVKE